MCRDSKLTNTQSTFIQGIIYASQILQQPVSANRGHVAATKKLESVASYPHCACGYPGDLSSNMRDLSSNMRYFPRISPISLKISPKFRATIHIQSLTNAHIFIKTKSFPLRVKGNFTGFNLIYCTPALCAVYTFLLVLIWKNVENLGKMAFFPGGYGRIGEILHPWQI